MVSEIGLASGSGVVTPSGEGALESSGALASVTAEGSDCGWFMESGPSSAIPRWSNGWFVWRSVFPVKHPRMPPSPEGLEDLDRTISRTPPCQQLAERFGMRDRTIGVQVATSSRPPEPRRASQAGDQPQE